MGKEGKDKTQTTFKFPTALILMPQVLHDPTAVKLSDHLSAFTHTDTLLYSRQTELKSPRQARFLPD
jgi:hypothetical protein